MRKVIRMQPSAWHSEFDPEQIQTEMARILETTEEQILVLTIGRPLSFVQASEILGLEPEDVLLYEGFPRDELVVEYADAVEEEVGLYPHLYRLLGSNTYERFDGINETEEPRWTTLDPHPKPEWNRGITIKRVFQPNEFQLTNEDLLEAMRSILRRLNEEIILRPVLGIPFTADGLDDLVNGFPMPLRKKDILIYQGRPPLDLLMAFDEARRDNDGDFPHLVRVRASGVFEEFISLDDDGTQHWEFLVKRPWVQGEPN